MSDSELRCQYRRDADASRSRPRATRVSHRVGRPAFRSAFICSICVHVSLHLTTPARTTLDLHISSCTPYTPGKSPYTDGVSRLHMYRAEYIKLTSFLL